MNRTTRKRLERLLEQANRELEKEPGNDLAAVATRVDMRQYALTLSLLQAGETGPEMAMALVRELRDATTASYEAANTIMGNRRVDCRTQCSWCCREPLQVSPLDAVLVASSLLDRSEYWASRLLSYKVPDRTGTVLKRNFTPCPFLGENQLCQVYDARPVICRAFHSTDVAVCKQRVEHPDGSRSVPMHMELFGFTGLPMEGAHRALDEAGIDRRPVVLGLAVRVLLEDFAGVTRRWLDGEASVWSEVAVLKQ